MLHRGVSRYVSFLLISGQRARGFADSNRLVAGLPYVIRTSHPILAVQNLPVGGGLQTAPRMQQETSSAALKIQQNCSAGGALPGTLLGELTALTQSDP